MNSLAVAEASKIYENIFRSVNIALVNEMKFAFNKIGINVWDVIKHLQQNLLVLCLFPGPG